MGGWEYMVQIEALVPQVQEEEEHRVVLYVQVEHYQKKSHDLEPKSIIPGLVPVDYESGLSLN